MSGFLFSLASFIAAIVILVTIHEFGHFWVARRCGVKIERFSVGFGPVLLRRFDKSGTEFALSAIPLGGYVAMYGGGTEPVPEDMRAVAFKHKTVWQRIAILFAGPLANILLAIALFWALGLGGTVERKPFIGAVEPDSLAAHAGLEVGQEIVAVDGVATPTWAALGQALIKRLGQTGDIELTLRYPDADYQYQSQLRIEDWLRAGLVTDPVEALGIELYIPEIPPIVGEIVPNGAADRAGVQAGDKFISVNQASITQWQALVDIIQSSPAQALSVSVERDNQLVDLVLTPDAVTESDKVLGRAGVRAAPFTYPEHLLQRVDYSVGGALIAGVERTWSTAQYVLLSVKKLILGEISTKNLSGPIGIAKVASASAESGWLSFLGFLGMLSVFLAVFNLLPIPTLDGGHLFYYFIEVIRKKPVSERVQQRGNMIGFLLIIILMCVAIFNDITQL